ncbi:MAG: UTP--glucose-1-phosphate uridylyltransferase [Candidatus Omnitrophota bacterium]|nr:UTP--glucose-1-phosphate uridylyltransferase [Candidatus Omnitrophota bacterium]
MHFKSFKKIASIIILTVFIANNSIYAAPDSKSIFKNKKVNYQKISDKNEGVVEQKKTVLAGQDVKESESRKKEARKMLSAHLSDISLIHIPQELGKVVEVYQNPGRDNSRLIVNIQDLHTNPEATINLAGILEILIKDYNLGLVCSEGAEGAVDTSSVSSFPDPEVRKKVAKLFVDSGELTGEEYLSITKYPNLAIWGIEDKDIYFKNIEEFNSIMKFNPDSRTFISQAKKALEGLKPRIYSKELLEIDRKESDYESQAVETADYLKYLSSYGQKLNIPTISYKNISLLDETMDKESKIDQQKITQESQNLLLSLQSAIAAKSNRSDMDTLMAKASLFKDQKISPFSFYSYLKDLADKYLKDQISKYPNLMDFIDYLTKVNSLDSIKLFVEIEDLSYEIKQKLARNEEEKTLTQALRNIKFLEGFFNLKISNEELDYYLQNKDSCKVAFFEAFLKPAIKKYNLSDFVDFNPGLIDPHLQEIEDFYKTVKARDLAMFINTVSEVEKRNIKVATLITGGFHTQGVTKLLKEKGYSYIVISPYSKTDIDEENYHFLLSGKRKPIEDLIKQLDQPEAINKVSANTNLRVPMTFDRGSSVERVEKTLERAAASGNGLVRNETFETAISESFDQYAAIHGADKRNHGLDLSMERLGIDNIRILLDDSVLSEKQKSLVRKLLAFGKGSVFSFWGELDVAQKKNLLNQLAMVDLEGIESLYKAFIMDKKEGIDIEVTENNVTMPKVVDITDTNGPGYAKAEKAGEGAFKNGEVCYLELAGGSGSRLGYEHAKIIFKASQVMNMSLARMRAKKIRALAEEYGKPVPWLIMTSDVTDREVREFFKNHIVNNKYFGEVPVQWVGFVRQRVMPQITDTGEFILNQAKDSVIVGGFGHGDARDYVLKDQGVLNWLTKNFRVKYIVMLNVDNAYVPGAPSVGYHIIATENLAPGTEKMSAHSVEKTGPGERVGMNVLFNGRSAVIEYNQVPDKLLYMTYIHVLDNDKIVFLKERGKYRILKVSQLKDNYRDVFQDPGWVRSNLVTVNDLPEDVSIDYLGRQYIKDMLVRAKLWLLLGNTNGLIWSMDSFTDQRYPLPELPVVVAKNKAVDGYHPETGEFFTKGDGTLKASKFECMAFQGFYHNPVMGAFILVPRPGYFAPIKEARGQDTPERARQIFAEYDASLLNNVNWMVATDATVELTPAFAFLDGRYLTHKMGQGGVIGRGSKLHLSGSNVHIGDMFNMGEGKTFILRFNDEHNKAAGAQIGNNIEVQGDISITISGSGNLIIDDDVRITGFQEYTINSNETLRITKNGPVWKTKKADQVLASNEGMDRFAQWDKWISMSVSIGDLNDDMFRDYDYRSIGKTLAPEMVFRFGLVWANMALEKAKANGFTNRKVLIARDARKIEPELVEALVAALRFAGLDVIYVAADGPNAVTSYSWAAQEHKPLMSIFLTASHVSRPKEIIVRGFKVAIMDESGTLQSLTTKEIMQTSKAAVKDLIVNPAKINTIKSMRQGEFMPSNVDANCVKMCVLVGKTVASGNSIYNLARELGASESPVTVLDDWDRRIGHLEPLKGMKMIVEGAHTPSGKLAADTFIGLGAEVILINGDIQEIEGEHEADPSIPKNLTGLERAIAAHNADFGIAFDLDGDRGAIVVPERWKATVGTKFHLLAPDNLIVSMLTYMIRRGGYDQAVIGREVGVIRDVLGTFAVNDMASRLGIKAFQTDAGYVFLKALRRQLLPRGYIVPVYGERSGHCWLDVTGEFENPIAVAVLFATMVKESKYKDNATQSKNPFLEAYEENIIPYLQSTRFQPLFHPKFLSELSSDLRNNTGWTYNAERPTNPPQAIIALGKDLGIQKLQQEFKVGNLYLTPAGNLRIKEFNTYQDVPDEGGLYRFADIVFEQDGKFAGRFVFRASSNDPTFVCSFETPLMDGETYISASLDNRYLSIGGVVLDWLESNGIAGVTGDIKYPNKDATELVVTKYRAKLASARGDAGRGSVFGLLNTMARRLTRQGNI